jgi:hypothetical protein
MDYSENIKELSNPILNSDATPKPIKGKNEFDENFTKSALWMAGAAVCFSVMSTFTKLLYINHPDFGEIELIFLRCALSVVIFLVLINKNAKDILWTSIPSGKTFTIITRVV